MMNGHQTFKNFKVAIVGGGMVGLTCAVPLVRAGIRVEIYEAAAKFGEIGAGVNIGPNSVHVLKRLGLLDTVLAGTGEEKPSFKVFKFISGFGDHELIIDYAEKSRIAYGTGVYRPSFIEGLAELLPPDVARFHKRCIKVEAHDAGNTLYFADGTTAEADLVVGADGIKSVVRKAVLDDYDDDRMAFTNTVAYRGLVPWETLKKDGVKTVMNETPICWMGKNQHVITFPIRCNTLINIVVFNSNDNIPIGSIKLPESEWAVNVTEGEVLREFGSWGPDVQILIRRLNFPLKWSIPAVHPPMKTYSRKNIAVAGDAAHGMLPHLGAGFGQGSEDAYILYKLLTHPKASKDNLEAILKAFSYVRLPRANFVAAYTKETGEIYDSYVPGELTKEDYEKRLVGRWAPVWFHDLDEDLKRAEESLGW